MKLLRYGPAGAEKPGLFANDGSIRDLSALVRDIDGFALSEASLSMIAGVDPLKLPRVEGNPRIGACVARPVNYVCIGLNYADHAAETGNPIPKEPIVFLKSLSAFTGPNDDVKLPRGSKKLDWEVELGVVIGKTARYVPENEAMDYVAGYCVCNDVSEREFQTERGGHLGQGQGLRHVRADRPVDGDQGRGQRPAGPAAVDRGQRQALSGRIHPDDDLRRGQAGELCQPLHHPACGRRDRYRHAAGRRRGRQAGAGVSEGRRRHAAGDRGPGHPDPADCRGVGHARGDEFSQVIIALNLLIRDRSGCMSAEPTLMQAEQFDQVGHAWQHRRDAAVRA